MDYLIKKRTHGVTLAEFLIVITLFLVIAAIVFGQDFFKFIKKTREVQKKQDFAVMRNVLEEYYVRNSKYPSVEDMTFEGVPDSPLAGKMCGNEKMSEELKPYIGRLPCDPHHPGTDYIYFSWNDNAEYALFTNIDTSLDDASKSDVCPYGCTYFTDEAYGNLKPSSSYFNYMVSSSPRTIGCDLKNITVCYVSARTGAGSCAACPYLSCANKTYKKVFCSATWCTPNCP